jgi:hypothetical protein
MLLAHLKVGRWVEAAAKIVSSNREEKDNCAAILVNSNQNIAGVNVGGSLNEAGKDEMRHLNEAVALSHDRQLRVVVGEGLKDRSGRNR